MAQVQTVRIATQPFSEYLPTEDVEEALRIAKVLDQACVDGGLQHVSIGPATTPHEARLVSRIVHETTTMLSSFQIPDPRENPRLANEMALVAAQSVLAASTATPSGDLNFRLCSIANVAPGCPFFPAGFHSASLGQRTFALGAENSDVLVSAANASEHKAVESEIDDDSPLAYFLDELTQSLTSHLTPLEQLGEALALASDGWAYRGIDTSIAPGGEPNASVMLAYSALTGSSTGGLRHPGALAVSGMITEACKSIPVKVCRKNKRRSTFEFSVHICL